MWSIDRVERYVNGKLPVPVAKNDQNSDQLLFLPNNKKEQYPNFLGYLKWTHAGVTVQYTITKENDGIYMKQKPPVADLDAALTLLMDQAKAEGYVFG